MLRFASTTSCLVLSKEQSVYSDQTFFEMWQTSARTQTSFKAPLDLWVERTKTKGVGLAFVHLCIHQSKDPSMRPSSNWQAHSVAIWLSVAFAVDHFLYLPVKYNHVLVLTCLDMFFHRLLESHGTASVLIEPTMMPIPRTAVSIKPVSQQLPLIVLLPTLACRGTGQEENYVIH